MEHLPSNLNRMGLLVRHMCSFTDQVYDAVGFDLVDSKFSINELLIQLLMAIVFVPLVRILMRMSLSCFWISFLQVITTALELVDTSEVSS